MNSDRLYPGLPPVPLEGYSLLPLEGGKTASLYELIGYVYSQDRLALEKEIHSKFERNNEWVKTDKTTIKRFLKDHEDYPVDQISLFCAEETIRAIGESEVIRNIPTDKAKVRNFMNQAKNVLGSVSDKYKTADVTSKDAIFSKKNIWYNIDIPLCVKVVGGVVKII